MTFICRTPFLKLVEKGHDKYIDKNAKLISNVILFAIREKTEDELTDSSVVEALSAEIIDKLSGQMDVSFIDSVLFNEFCIA